MVALKIRFKEPSEMTVTSTLLTVVLVPSISMASFIFISSCIYMLRNEMRRRRKMKDMKLLQKEDEDNEQTFLKFA